MGFIDEKGVEYLWKKISLEDYPNNEMLIAVLNAIDETKLDKNDHSWNELKDKPFSEEVTEIKEVIDDGSESLENITFTNVTEWGYDVSHFNIGDTYTVIFDNVEYTCVGFDLSENSVNGDYYNGVGNMSMVSDEYEDTGEPFVIICAFTRPVYYDTYIIEAKDGGTHTISLYRNVEVETIEYLDEKYIPDTIARVEQITPHDWETLKNKPFEMDVTTEQSTFLEYTFTGTGESEYIRSISELLGEDLIITLNDETYETACEIDGALAVIRFGDYTIEEPIASGGMGEFSPTVEGEEYNLTIERISKISTIPDSVIPDSIARLDDIPEVTPHDWNTLLNKPTETIGGDTLTWDGDTSGLEVVGLVSSMGATTNYYKISDNIITDTELADGISYTAINGVTNTITFNQIKNAGVVIFVTEENTNYSNILMGNAVFEKVGVYFAEGIISLTIPNYSGFTKEVLKEEYLPDTIARTTYVDEQFTTKADADHDHDNAYDVKGAASEALDEAKSYADTKTSNMATTTVVDNKITTHNTSTTAHSDIRDLISALTTEVTSFLNVDDETRDQLSEVLALIDANKGTLDSLTSSKVNVSDIVDNLTTNNSAKVLSAKQGVVLKGLIDALQTAVDGKAASSHSHAISEVTNLQSTLDAKASSTHNHGLLHTNFTKQLDNTTTDSGWSMINDSYSGFLLKSLRTQQSAPNWAIGNYSAGIAFGGADTKGVITHAYNSPSVRFAGGNGDTPVWYMSVTGTSSKTYNFDNMPLATKATQDGSGNTITSTYETKTDASDKLIEAKDYTDQSVDFISETINTQFTELNTDLENISGMNQYSFQLLNQKTGVILKEASDEQILSLFS